MIPLSVVILTRNEEHNIVRCLQALEGLSSDVLVADNGSTDHTKELAAEHGARVIELTWKGYSQTKNEANTHARFSWILSLDADEVMNPELRDAIRKLFEQEPGMDSAYRIRRKLVYEGKVLQFGAVAREYRTRLFHRDTGTWNAREVHENLAFPSEVRLIDLPGFVWHHSYADAADHAKRLEQYARLFAKQMQQKGRIPGYTKRYMSAVFGFVKNYVFKGGFLDGTPGLHFALNEMDYTFNKYRYVSGS